MLDDVVFFSSFFLCMSLGGYYKRIKDLELKKNYGAGLGLLVTCLICGLQIYHSALLVWGNIIIIKCCDKKYIHQISLAFTWTYLVYLQINWPQDIFVLWLHQTIALRLVGLAFEVHVTWKSKALKWKSADKVITHTVDSELLNEDPTAIDILTYSYFFIGILKGPYYRWKLLEDHLESPFGVLGNFRILTEFKLKKAFIYFLGYILLRAKYSPTIYLEDSFYLDFGSELRYLYNVPQLIMFFLYHQTVSMLSSGICTETGFGVYPSKCVAMPGYGPTTGAEILTEASKSTESAMQQEYNFAMLKYSDNSNVIFGPTMAETIRSWDMATRHWFKAYTYRLLLKSSSNNKEVRSALTFAAYCVWSGFSVQNAIVCATLWVYVHLEHEFAEITETKAMCTFPWSVGFSIMRIFCLLYLTPCFLLTDTTATLRYYNSIYWVYHIILLLLLIFAFTYCKVYSIDVARSQSSMMNYRSPRIPSLQTLSVVKNSKTLQMGPEEKSKKTDKDFDKSNNDKDIPSHSQLPLDPPNYPRFYKVKYRVTTQLV